MATALRGTAPEIFKGERQHAETYKQDFDLYRGLNVTNDLMTNAYNRCMTFLSMIRGPLVKDWVREQMDDINNKVNRVAQPLLNTDEALWNDLITAFDTAFTDTTQKQKAYRLLHQIKMREGNLDSFVSVFKQLAKKAGYDLTAQGTIDLFYRGLTRDLLQAIMTRDTQPDTFQEWVDAAQKELQKQQHRNAILYPQRYQRPDRPHSHSRNGHLQRHPNDRTVPMDVDYAKVQRAYTEEDKIKWKVEGRCFRCDKQGHMARECPLRKSQETPFKPFKQYKPFKGFPSKQSYQKQSYNKPQRKQGYRKYNKPHGSKPVYARGARIEEVESEDEQQEEEDAASVARQAMKLPEDEKEKLFAEMLDLDIKLNANF
jgi:hypothetical protein